MNEHPEPVKRQPLKLTRQNPEAYEAMQHAQPRDYTEERRQRFSRHNIVECDNCGQIFDIVFNDRCPNCGQLV